MIPTEGPYRYTEGPDHTESQPLHAELAGLVHLYGAHCMLQSAARDCTNTDQMPIVAMEGPLYTR